MSDGDAHGCRYYIDGSPPKVQFTRRPSGATSTDGVGTYHAAGRCIIGGCLPNGDKITKKIEFSVTYRDMTDEHGLADVEYIDPTKIEELGRNTPIDLRALK